MSDEFLTNVLNEFKICSPNDGRILDLESFKSIKRIHGESEKNTLISLALMAEMNRYIPQGTKEKLKSYLKKHKK